MESHTDEVPCTIESTPSIVRTTVNDDESSSAWINNVILKQIRPQSYSDRVVKIGLASKREELTCEVTV